MIKKLEEVVPFETKLLERDSTLLRLLSEDAKVFSATPECDNCTDFTPPIYTRSPKYGNQKESNYDAKN
jgi:hypothetical protein